MIERDREIIRALEKFKVMRRDDIAELFFSHAKNAVTQANRTLLRLRRGGYITCSPDFQHQYVYFPVPSIKRNSQKIPHFLEIVDVYKAMHSVKSPRRFDVEPKVGVKGSIEPDVFAIWKGTPMFIEIQRNVYSKKVMTRKINRYKSYYLGDKWRALDWQPADRKLFPLILIITDHIYDIDAQFKVEQVRSIGDFIARIKKS